MKKIYVCLFITLSFIACENDESVEATSHNLKFKFDKTSNYLNRDSDYSFEIEGTIIKSNGTLTLISEELEMSKAINQETGKESYLVFLKISEIEIAEDSGEPVRRIKHGYFYDGNDCWIAGTWLTGDNGVSIFLPGSAATQFLNNICGWSNVA